MLDGVFERERGAKVKALSVERDDDLHGVHSHEQLIDPSIIVVPTQCVRSELRRRRWCQTRSLKNICHQLSPFGQDESVKGLMTQLIGVRESLVDWPRGLRRWQCHCTR